MADGAPIDGFGVDSALFTSSDKPVLDMAYKLLELGERGRAKYSSGKRFLPGAKQIFRAGTPDTDVLELRGADAEAEPLLEPVWEGRTPPRTPDLDTARERAAE